MHSWVNRGHAWAAVWAGFFTVHDGCLRLIEIVDDRPPFENNHTLCHRNRLWPVSHDNSGQQDTFDRG